MSWLSIKNKIWIVALALFVAGAGAVFFWQQLQAQSPTASPSPGPATALSDVATPGTPPTTAPSPAAPPATVQSSEPTVPLRAVLPSNVKVLRIKNWDGRVIEMLRFKYKTLDGRVITVHLPASYKSQQMTKAGWDTLFQVFSMDKEAALEEREKRQSQSISPELMAQFVNEARNAASQFTPPSEGTTNPASGALDFARTSLPSTGMQLPPLMPTTPAGTIINP
jgi:hypothetical protein